MTKIHRWRPSKTQFDDLILPAYTFISGKCVAYIQELKCHPQYIADMIRDVADAIMTTYPEVKNNNYIF